MLLVTLALFTFVLLSEAMWRIRDAHLRANRDAHRATFEKLTGGTLGIFGGITDFDLELWFFAPDAVELAMNPEPPDDLSIDGLPNDVVQGKGERDASIMYVGPYGRLAPVSYKFAAMGVSTPWAIWAEPVLYSQTWFEADDVQTWYDDGVEASTGDYKDPLKLDDP